MITRIDNIDQSAVMGAGIQRLVKWSDNLVTSPAMTGENAPLPPADFLAGGNPELMGGGVFYQGSYFTSEAGWAGPTSAWFYQPNIALVAGDVWKAQVSFYSHSAMIEASADAYVQYEGAAGTPKVYFEFLEGCTGVYGNDGALPPFPGAAEMVLSHIPEQVAPAGTTSATLYFVGTLEPAVEGENIDIVWNNVDIRKQI